MITGMIRKSSAAAKLALESRNLSNCLSLSVLTLDWPPLETSILVKYQLPVAFQQRDYLLLCTSGFSSK